MTPAPLPIDKQILNIVSELSRSRTWLLRQDNALMKTSLERVFELTDSAAQCAAESKQYNLSRELLRMREFLGGFYVGTETDGSALTAAIQNLLDFTHQNHELHLEL